MNDFFTAAKYICNPMARPNYPLNPPSYYDTIEDRRERYADARRKEIADDIKEGDTGELASALALCLERNPDELCAAVVKSCGGTLVAAIELQDIVDKAIDALIDDEWGKK